MHENVNFCKIFPHMNLCYCHTLKSSYLNKQYIYMIDCINYFVNREMNKKRIAHFMKAEGKELNSFIYIIMILFACSFYLFTFLKIFVYSCSWFFFLRFTPAFRRNVGTTCMCIHYCIASMLPEAYFITKIYCYVGKAFSHLSNCPLAVVIVYRCGGVVGSSVRLASGRLGVRIPAATDRSRKNR